jgi:hypothetical protein
MDGNLVFFIKHQKGMHPLYLKIQKEQIPWVVGKCSFRKESSHIIHTSVTWFQPYYKSADNSQK